MVHRLRGRGVEADGVRGARQEHAADALLARGVEHGPRAVDVRREDVLPRPLPADAPEVHHDVRAAHDLAHRSDVAHRGDDRALPVDRIRIHQVEEHRSWPAARSRGRTPRPAMPAAPVITMRFEVVMPSPQGRAPAIDIAVESTYVSTAFTLT